MTLSFDQITTIFLAVAVLMFGTFLIKKITDFKSILYSHFR